MGRFFQKLNSTYGLLVNSFIAAFLLFAFLLFKFPEEIKAQAFGLARETMKKAMEIKTYNWHVLEGDYFRVKYQPVDGAVARLVLDTAEDSFQAVNELLEYEPRKIVPIYIYPDRLSLSKSFGWDGAVDAMGVYWAGAIRILSPFDWIENEEKFEEIFRKRGPIAHEYAHLLVDYKTFGNYPRWLTEGIALYVERELAGIPFFSKIGSGNWYSFKEMDTQFDLLSNQDLAYQQSFLAVEFIIEIAGFEGILAILDELGKGAKIEEALEKIIGRDLLQFERDFKVYVKE